MSPGSLTMTVEKSHFPKSKTWPFFGAGAASGTGGGAPAGDGAAEGIAGAGTEAAATGAGGGGGGGAGASGWGSGVGRVVSSSTVAHLTGLASPCDLEPSHRGTRC